MSEQELRTSITPCIMAGNTWFVFEQIKAYADAQVEAKDAEIAELKAEWDKTRNYLVERVDKAEVANAKLNAEIKRLREGIQKGFEKLTEIPYCSVLRTIFDNAKIVQNSLESLLSPAPVTEGKENERQLLKDRYAAISDKIEAIGECHDSEKMEELKHKISDRLDEIGWNSPKNEDQK